MSNPQKHIAAVGAGPRGVSVAILANILRQKGVADIEVTLFEKEEVGANWKGNNGYTDGQFPLDTSPYKDISFPPCSTIDPDIPKVLKDYSFYDYARETGFLQVWVNQGQSRIPHARFSEYLKWCTAKANLRVKKAIVQNVKVRDSRLELQYFDKVRSEDRIASFDGVLIGGPGYAGKLHGQTSGMDDVYDARTYWMNREKISALENPRIAIVGAGQSAGTIGCSVLSENPSAKLTMINSLGFLPVQSSGAHENALCTNASGSWEGLSLETRLEICRRANNGVMESYIKEKLDASNRLEVVGAKVSKIETVSNGIKLSTSNDDVGVYDVLIVAIGFNSLAQLSHLFSSNAKIAELLNSKHIDLDANLRIPALGANIHVPALAALSQGPGLSLLSCLSTMAERVLTPYLPANAKLITPNSKNEGI